MHSIVFAPTAFCAPNVLALSRAAAMRRTPAAARGGPVMRAKKPRQGNGKSKPKPSSLSPEQKAGLRDVARNFGVDPPKPGADLDRRFTSKARPPPASSPSSTPPSQSLYQMLAGAVGTRTLDAVEGATYYVLAAILVSFLSIGVAIAAQASYKASGGEAPPALTAFSDAAVQGFTPLLGLLVALSSLLGIYKQSQLNSGAAQYDETRPPR